MMGQVARKDPKISERLWKWPIHFFSATLPDRIACASLDFWSLSYAAAAAHGSGGIGKRCYRQTLHNCNRTESRIKC